MVEESVVTDEVRALEGKMSAPVRVRITPLVARRARETFGGTPAGTPQVGDPAPGYVLAALEAEVEQLGVPELLPSSLLVANEWSFEAPLRVGDELEAVSRIDAINERFGGRMGYTVHVRTATDFSRDGMLVARSTRTLAYYDPAESRMDGGE